MKFLFVANLIFSLVTTPSQAAKPAHPGDLTTSPQRYVLDHSKKSTKGLTQFDCKTCSYMKDLLFVAPSQECGSNGCFFYVFKPAGSAYKLETTLFLRSNAFQFLPGQSHGLNDLLFYQSLSPEEGFIIKDQYDGKKYVGVGKPKKIKNAELKNYLKSEIVTRTYFDSHLKAIPQPK